MTDQEIIIRLCVATLLGGLVGFEREKLKRAAGLRTHMLVCLGSALVMVISIFLAEEYMGRTNIDPTRLAGHVVSGIGFLGAGTIIRSGTSVKGLTTAASLWVVAAVGLAAGAGYWKPAVLTTLLVLLGLVFFGRVLHRFFPFNEE